MSGCAAPTVQGAPAPSEVASTGQADRTPASVPTIDSPKVLAMRWWQWAGGFNTAESPISDRTGENCRRRQPDDVFFLAGSWGETVHRACRVDAGKPVFLPAVNVLCWDGDASDCRMSGARGRVTLDGKQVAMEEVSNRAFSIQVPRNSPFGISRGAHDAIAWGFWSGPFQLTPGQHQLHLVAQADTFSLDVTYDLDVRSS